MSTTCIILGRERFGEGDEKGSVEVEAGELEFEDEAMLVNVEDAMSVDSARSRWQQS